MRNWISKVDSGFSLESNRYLIDDQAIIQELEHHLRRTVHQLHMLSGTYSLKISICKTQNNGIRKKILKIILNNKVSHFNYLDEFYDDMNNKMGKCQQNPVLAKEF